MKIIIINSLSSLIIELHKNCQKINRNTNIYDTSKIFKFVLVYVNIIFNKQI